MLLPGLVPVQSSLAQKQAASAAGISESSIVTLQTEFDITVEIESTMERRRLLKRVVRSAQSLLKEHPQARNRFQVFGVIFQTQKELMILKNDSHNQEALLGTCKKLMDAPDEYAVERIEPEVLLLQLELDRKGATEHEQAVSIAKLADSYRDTPAEEDSLIIASELAFNLGQADLLSAMRYTLSRKFRESAKAIGFLKDRFASKSSSLLFRGRFKREDGETLVLPIDRAGHVYLTCFWSQGTRDLKQKLSAIKDLQQKYPGRFEVLSFNLDELSDAGKSTLDACGLDWTPLHLQDGSNNQLFRACGSDSSFLIRIVNANGYIILTPIRAVPDRFGRVFGPEEYLNITMDKARFMSLTQTVRIGDFLVQDYSRPLERNLPPHWEKGALPAESLRAIQTCFIAPPMRYRLTKEQAIKNYTKAAGLCADLIAQHPDSSHLWFVYNRRIIALLGVWNLSGEPKYLKEALAASSAVLTEEIPRQAQVVPRFCLAKEALRQVDADSEAILAEFINATGEDKACALSIAAATVLSLDASSPVLYHKFSERLLDEQMDNPRVWPLRAYFFNKFVAGRLFRGNYYGSEARVFYGFREWQKNTEIQPRKFLIKLLNLKGEPMAFPHSDSDKSNVVVFMDLPADEISVNLQIDFVKRLDALAKSHIHKNVNFVVAFVSDDLAAVQALVKKNNWSVERIAMVPDGLKNPHLVRLGVFLADQRPNTFIVAHDGTIIWSMSGMYQMSTGVNAITGTVREKIQKHDLTIGQLALEQGSYEKALRIFTGTFPPNPRAPLTLKNALRLGRARAHMGLDKWPTALQDFNAIIAEHTQDAIRNPCACYSLARKLRARTDLLEQLGKYAEATADRKRAEHLDCHRGGKVRFNPNRFEQELFNRVDGYIYSKEWKAAYDYVNEIIVHGKDGRQAEREVMAGWLRERAEILRQLGETEKVQQDLQWSEALTKGIKSNASASGAEPRDKLNPRRYVDVVT